MIKDRNSHKSQVTSHNRNILFFVLCLVSCVSILFGHSPAFAEPFQAGETINYEIKKLGVKLGDATLTYHGPEKYKGHDTLLIVFKAEGLHFYDEERIYMDPKTFLPLFVVRGLDIWGKVETIEEVYDQKNFNVKVTKDAKGKTTEVTLHKKEAIDNIYCFLYRYRNAGSFKMGELLVLSLPTKDVAITASKLTKIKAADKDYEALFLKSDPDQYKLWFDVSDRRLPLRIDGSLGIGKTAMIMKSYEP